MMKIGEMVYLPNRDEIVMISDIKEEWDSFPHGSGNTYNIYTFERCNGETFQYNDFYGDRIEIQSAESLERTNNYLLKKIEEIEKQIEYNKSLIYLLTTK